MIVLLEWIMSRLLDWSDWRICRGGVSLGYKGLLIIGIIVCAICLAVAVCERRPIGMRIIIAGTCTVWMVRLALMHIERVGTMKNLRLRRP